ncbi:MAG: PKD domain-containing protein [Deltaproteobacteria bacterium]|nr:PKD domain-containing protein [Deltaproteobacteria bacterium]MBI3387740.1 PKD domain-containing protein [Deltaproteobacteria bacterium]
MTTSLRFRFRFLTAAFLVFISTRVLAAEYFVAPTGDDANAGADATPWRTVSHAANQVQAGDTVTIHPGTYSESPWLATSGAPGAPITFTAEPGAVFESPDPNASEEAFNVAGAGYVRLVGFEATGGFDETIFLRPGSHHIEISDCKLYGNHIGILIADSDTVTVSNCSLHNNVRAGLRVAGTTHNVLVSDTESFNNNDGLGCDGQADGYTGDRTASNISFVRTKAHDNGQDGFDVPATGAFFDQVESANNACAGFKIWSDATLSNCLVRGNHTGIGTTSATGNTTVTITNCTVVDNGLGVVAKPPMTAGTRYSVNLFNNILVGPDHVIDFYDTVNLTEARNILWRGDLTGNVIQQLTATGAKKRRFSGREVNLGRWQRVMKQGEGTLAIDPQLNGDYAPATVSAAVDRARSDVAPPTDYAGTPRPQGNGPDIGAIEIPGGVINHQPLADCGAANRIGRATRRLLFNAAGSLDPDGDVLTYSWDFGDGSPALLGARVLHAFATAGVYTVTLTVSDGQLSGQRSLTVTVL